MNSKRPKRPVNRTPARRRFRIVLPALKEDELAAVRREARNRARRIYGSGRDAKPAEAYGTRTGRDREVRRVRIARELLPVLDNFECASASASAAQDIETLTDGVRIACEHFLKVLHAHHIEPIAAAGGPLTQISTRRYDSNRATITLRVPCCRNWRVATSCTSASCVQPSSCLGWSAGQSGTLSRWPLRACDWKLTTCDPANGSCKRFV